MSDTIDHGEVFALLGHNGAGTTTAAELLEGHRRRTSGSVKVLGSDPQDGGRTFRERVEIVLPGAGLDDDFSVRELVELYRGMYPRRLDNGGLIDQVGLSDKTNNGWAPDDQRPTPSGWRPAVPRLGGGVGVGQVRKSRAAG